MGCKYLATMFSCLIVFSSGLAFSAADHPGSDSKCLKCHEYDSGPEAAPKVVPERPGFWARLLGEKPIQGHPSISCSGVADKDGSVTGCHRPENGNRDYLVLNLDKRPTDELCGKCHPEQRTPGGHHPTFKSDKDSDGVAEKIISPAEGQEVFTDYAPSAKSEPLKSFPDALAFVEQSDESSLLDVALPLETVVEPNENGQETEYANTVVCTTCHNPHYGYFVSAGSEEDLNRELVAREAGDALLRLKDYDNTLCNACH